MFNYRDNNVITNSEQQYIVIFSTFASRGPLRTGRAVAGLLVGAVPIGFIPDKTLGREVAGCCEVCCDGVACCCCCCCCWREAGLRPGAVLEAIDTGGGIGSGLGAELTDRGDGELGAAPYCKH